MNLFFIKFVENGHDDGSIGQRSQEGYCPVGGISAADGHPVALFYSRGLHHDVQFLYLASHIMVLECGSFIVCQGIEQPVILDGNLDE